MTGPGCFLINEEWSDRQNGITPMIRPRNPCHSECNEESKIHNRKTRQPVPRFYHDQERKRRKYPLCQLYLVTDTLDSSTPLPRTTVPRLRSGECKPPLPFAGEGLPRTRYGGKCLPLSARRSDTQPPISPPLGERYREGVLTKTEQLHHSDSVASATPTGYTY